MGGFFLSGYNDIMVASAFIPHLIQLTLAAGTKLSTEQKRELLWLILFVIAAGIALIVTVVLLMRSNRRQLMGLEPRQPKKPAVIPDIWKAGGDRLVARMSPFPKANPSDAHLDAAEDDDSPASPPSATEDELDEEDDENQPPR